MRLTKTMSWIFRPFQGIVPQWPKNEIAEILKKEMPNLAKAMGTRHRPLVQAAGAVDDRALSRLEPLMPALFSEMRGDLKDAPLRREFILMHKNAIYSSGGKSILAYFYEDHDDLSDKAVILANSGARDRYHLQQRGSVSDDRGTGESTCLKTRGSQMLLKPQVLPVGFLKNWEAEFVETTALNDGWVSNKPTGYSESSEVEGMKSVCSGSAIQPDGHGEGREVD